MIGFVFADESEAKTFHKKTRNKFNEKDSKTCETLVLSSLLETS